MTALNSILCGWVLLLGSTAEAAISADTAPERMLTKEVTVAASLDEVWHAWTTPEGLASFFSPESNIELRVGGAYELLLNVKADENGKRGAQGCKVLSYVPRELLSFEWTFPPSIPSLRNRGAKTSVVLRFDPVGRRHVRVRFAQLGWGKGEDWDEGYAYFDKAWGWVLNQLKERFDKENDAASATERQSKTLSLIRLLIGGEWTHESTGKNGEVFRVRNVAEDGPGGASIVIKGWFGTAEGMSYHGHSQIWREPSSGEIRFQNVNENGDLARGAIQLESEQTLVWDWNVQPRKGPASQFIVKTKFKGKDSYDMCFVQESKSGHPIQANTISFTRVDAAPARFKKIRPPSPS